MAYTRNPNSMFLAQRHHAKLRGIPFNFTKDQWVKWWQDNLGHDWHRLRGRGLGKYVMARNGDKGAYEPSNVSCILSEYNHKSRKPVYGKSHGKSKLDDAKALAIRAAKGSHSQIALAFGISKATVTQIKAGKTWKHVNASC